jgi:hypothetical protein
MLDGQVRFELANPVSLTRVRIEKAVPTEELRCCSVLRAGGIRVWGTFSVKVK